MAIEHFDVVIIGAGLSGVGAAYRLQTKCSKKRYAIFEGRAEIGDGPAILKYVRETAREFGIDRHIRFQHKAVSASWSSKDLCWSLAVQNVATGEVLHFTCDFLYGCTGYYRYDS